MCSSVLKWFFVVVSVTEMYGGPKGSNMNQKENAANKNET